MSAPHALPAALDATLAPLDHLRVLVLRALGPVGRHLVRERDDRVATNATIAVLVATLCTALASGWMLALGPLVFGVPHLLADLRYLVLADGLHRRAAWWVACAAPVAAFGLGADASVGLVGVVGAAAIADGPVHRRLLVGLVGLALVAGAAQWPALVALALAHAHNLVGVAAWWAWRRRTGRAHAAPLAAFALVYGALLAGALDGVTPWLPGPLADPARLVAPGVAAPWGPRLVVSFAFAQQVHYSVWLRLVPDDARARTTARSLRRTLADTLADLGPAAVGLAACAVVGLLVGAWFDLEGARDAYFRLARFHGALEFAVLAGWLAAGRARWP